MKQQMIEKLATLYNWASGKTAREQEHNRNRLIKELAQTITQLRETPGLAAQAREDYQVRRPLGKPLMDLYKYTDAETRTVVLGALDAVAAIDPVVAADWMSDVSNYGTSKAVQKPVLEKLVALSDSLPVKDAMAKLGTVAIYIESLRDAVAEKIIARTNAMPQDEAFNIIAGDLGNDYQSARKLVPALLALAAKEGMTAEQKTRAYGIVALRGTYDRTLWTKAISDWETAVTKDLPVDKGLKAAREMLENHYVKNNSGLSTLRQAAVRAVNVLAPQAADPEEQRRAAHGLLEHAPKGGVEWTKAVQTDLAALDKLPLGRSVEMIAWYGRPSAKTGMDDAALAAKWAEIVVRSEPDDLEDAIMERLYDRNDSYRQKIGAVEHAILKTWVDIQLSRPVEDAWRDAQRVSQRPGGSYNEYNVLREVLRREYLPQLLVTLADRLPPETALAAVHAADSAAENGAAAGIVAQKWGQVVRGLEPEFRLKEAYRVAEGYTENAMLRAEAVAVEKEACQTVACGMTPQAFLSKIGAGPNVR